MTLAHYVELTFWMGVFLVGAGIVGRYYLRSMK